MGGGLGWVGKEGIVEESDGKRANYWHSHKSTGKGPSMIFVKTLRYSLFHRPVDPDCSFHALRKAQNQRLHRALPSCTSIRLLCAWKTKSSSGFA